MRRRFSWVAVLAAVLLVVGGSAWSQEAPAAAEPEATTEFAVTVVEKEGDHPYLGVGSPRAFAIDGEPARELVLQRGTTYTFTLDTPNHPFYISTDPVGGNGGVGEVTTGVEGSQSISGTLSFTPDESHPDLLYYQCAVHPNMGWEIRLVD